MPDKLPEEFAPTGPKLSRFPIQPAPPIRPHLFADEARFALRLAVLAGATEFAAWAWLAGSRSYRVIFALAALRLLKPVWAKIGTWLPRPLLALALLLAAAISIVVAPGSSLAMVAVGLPAVSDLCATCIGDSVTVERRSPAFAWLDIGSGLGAMIGLASAFLTHRPDWSPSMPLTIATLGALLAASIGVRDLHDRGTPRSSWPPSAYLLALRSL